MNFLKIRTSLGNALINLNAVKMIYADRRGNGTTFVFDEEKQTIATEPFEDIAEKILKSRSDTE